ncbi:MAG: diguanylate cyclase [Rhodobacterales bacterium]|nr:diguanylate cyclase [Rhodobacterales bacterium]
MKLPEPKKPTRPIAMKLKQLPSPPAGLNMVLQACKQPDVSLHKLSLLVCAEPGLVIELLRVANSAWNSPPRTIRSGQQAVLMLGARVVRNHAVAHVLRAVAADVDIGEFNGDLFWTHALRRATAALVLGREAGCEDPWEMFTVGLIQDSGTLLMAAMWPHASAGLTAVQNLPADIRIETEQALVGISHADLFSEIAKVWGLPEDIVTAVANHHGETPKGLSRQAKRLCELARTADLLADVFIAPTDTDVVGRAATSLTSLASRSPLHLEKLILQIESEMPLVADHYRLPEGDGDSVSEMVGQAIASIVQITHHYEHVTQELEALLEEKQRLTRQLEISNSRLQQMATIDDLTGQANRRFFTHKLQMSAKICAENQRPISVVMLDIDSFKVVNDNHGHAAGDIVLRAVAECIAEIIRPDDLLGRLGGEEFGILLPNTNQEVAFKVATACQEQLANTTITTLEGAQLMVTASFGGCTSHHPIDPEVLLHQADGQMYRAKRAGGNRVFWPQERRKPWN